jgi:hypothetical protein
MVPAMMAGHGMSLILQHAGPLSSSSARGQCVEARYCEPAESRHWPVSPLADAADWWLSAPRAHPRNPEAHHSFGAVFFRAGDHERARRHLAEVGRSVAPARARGYADDADRLLDRARRDVRA